MRKKILITGGTGFVGRNLALRLRDKYEVVLSARNNYFNNYAQRETGCMVVPLNVTSTDSIRDALNRCKPDILIHAAATKYVDLAEVYPHECIDINIIGSRNIANAAAERNLEHVIGISTDKAARPCNNIYGMSKAMMEKIFLLMNNQSATRFTCVRFGNVVWSTGSVLPVWKGMLQKAGKIKTSGPHMRRFFFSVHDACEMIEDALDNPGVLQGKVLARHMKSVQISSLLERFVALNGGTHEIIEPVFGESIDEIMIGESEYPFTSNINLNNHSYFLIDYDVKQSIGLKEPFTTYNAERLSSEEMDRLISEEYNNYI